MKIYDSNVNQMSQGAAQPLSSRRIHDYSFTDKRRTHKYLTKDKITIFKQAIQCAVSFVFSSKIAVLVSDCNTKDIFSSINNIFLQNNLQIKKKYLSLHSLTKTQQKLMMVPQLCWQSKGLKILVSLVRIPVAPQQRKAKQRKILIFNENRDFLFSPKTQKSAVHDRLWWSKRCSKRVFQISPP